MAENKRATLEAEIAQYEHPFTYYLQGRYRNNSKNDGKSIEIVIPNTIDFLKENHSPYFEFIFDEDLNFNEEQPGRDLYEFFCNAHYLEFLRHTLAGIQDSDPTAKNKLPGSNKAAVPIFDSFEDVFKDQGDFEKVVVYLQSIYVLAEDRTINDVHGNKKHFAVLPTVLKLKKKIKPVGDRELALLMSEAFKMTISPDYISRNFKGRQELLEEMKKDIQF